MKQCLKKSICVLLVLVLWNSSAIFVSAAEKPVVRVRAYSDVDNQYRLIDILKFENKAYIKAEDALIVSGYQKYSEDYGKAIFEYGNHKVEYKEGQEDYVGTFYYPLQNLMDALSVRYYYDDSTSTIVFLTCSSFYENLLVDCEEIFLDNYLLDFYEGTGWQVAGVYEIMSGMRFDAIWGGYQRELYEETIAGIITESDNSKFPNLKQGDAIMSKLGTLLGFVNEDIDGVETYEEFLGTDIDGIIEAYSLINKLIPGISVKNAVEIIDYVENSMTSAETFPNAVKYGLVNNNYIGDKNMVDATHKVYNYYDANKPTCESVLHSLFTDVTNAAIKEIPFEEITMELIEETIGIHGFYINSAYVKLTKLIYDELGMRERSTAVMQTVACRNIQEVAAEQFLNGQSLTAYVYLDGYSAIGERAKTVKYSTLLYLRACQYAYSLYEFDDDLEYATTYWRERTIEAISKIASYSDEELSMFVCNEPIDCDLLVGIDEQMNGNVNPVDLLTKYYDNNIKEAKVAFLADVTGDDSQEMIIIEDDGELITGYVYTIKHNKVTLLYTNQGGHSHVTGFYAWYITKGIDDDSFYLVEETFGMWQGMGELSVEVYDFEINLEKRIINKVELKSTDEPVSAVRFKEYQSMVGDILGNSYEIYTTFSERAKNSLHLSSDKFIILPLK